MTRHDAALAILTAMLRHESYAFNPSDAAKDAADAAKVLERQVANDLEIEGRGGVNFQFLEQASKNRQGVEGAPSWMDANNSKSSNRKR